MRAGSLICLAVLVALPVACGGRFERGEGEGGGASTSGGANQGATSSMGAKPGKAGASSVGGTDAVGTGGGVSVVAGSTGFAGSPVGTGGSCACPDFDCGPGTYPVPNPDGCCFHCQAVPMPCPAIGCTPGNHPEVLPGQMCPVCVLDSCAEQRKYYEGFKSELLMKYSSPGCMVNQDCTIWWEKNQCAVGCGIALPLSAVNNLDSNLQSYAQQNCSPMCPMAVPPCDPSGSTPVCIQGLCRVPL
jgi:hypothetical protein